MGYLRQKMMRFILLLTAIATLLLCAAISVYAAEPVATGIIGEGGVNVRANYSTSSEIVTTLNQNTSVTVVLEKHTDPTSTVDTSKWYAIRSGSVSGWVRGDCISVSYAPVTATTTTAVNVRQGPGTIFLSEGKLSQGSAVTARLKAENATGEIWYQVEYLGMTRYMKASYLKFPEDNIAQNANFSTELAAFPSSYHASLRALHEKYPAWHFKAKTMNYTWKDGLAEQMASYKANTIPTSKPDGYKMVAKGTYNFDTHKYIGLDGANWVAASKKAVAYYMDPRNWLDEINVFMFESLLYDSATQSETMVKSLLSQTAIDPSYSSSYMLAGQTYNISPVYLAAKSRLELGSSDFMVSGTKFTYNGKTYQGYYNAYNIGASDSASGDAAKKGLVFAASGTSYLRPWTTLDLAIRGGAKYIAEDFVGNNQHTLYYERFNAANGLSAIGTHQYMTNTMAAATQANITYWEYADNKMLNTAFTFEIPVYLEMPASKAGEPKKGNNNYYLDSLKVYDGSTRKYFTKTFDRFSNSYTLKTAVPYDVKTLTVKAATNADDAKVTITGNTDLQVGNNKIKVKVTSASGLYKYYYVNVTRENAKTVMAPELKVTNVASSGKPKLTWSAAPNADEYQVYRSTSKKGTYKLLKTVTGCQLTNTTAKAGTMYYYKVKAVGTSGIVGEATSNIVYRTCDLPRPVMKTSNVASTGKVKISWKKIDGAKSYEVYRADTKNGTYKKLASTSKSYLINTSAQAGKGYYYKVKAVAKKSAANSAYSTRIYRVCDLKRPVVTMKRSSKGKPKVTWKAIDGTKTYEVYRATSKKGTYKKVGTTKRTYLVNTKAKKGKTYYYKVRAVSKRSAANSAYSLIKSKKSR